MQLVKIDLNYVRLEIAKSVKIYDDDVHTTLPESHCVCCHCQLKEEIEGSDVSLLFFFMVQLVSERLWQRWYGL